MEWCEACGKVDYPTRKEARRQARASSYAARRRGQSHKPSWYPCALGGGWHITLGRTNTGKSRSKGA